MSNGNAGWWCCMKALEKCLPRNDIVRELAPYLQHVHRDETETLQEEDLRELHTPTTTTNGDPNSCTPLDCQFVPYEDTPSATSDDSPPFMPVSVKHSDQIPSLSPNLSSNRSNRTNGEADETAMLMNNDEALTSTAVLGGELNTPTSQGSGSTGFSSSTGFNFRELYKRVQHPEYRKQYFGPQTPQSAQSTPSSRSQTFRRQLQSHLIRRQMLIEMNESGTPRSMPNMDSGWPHPLEKKASLPRIKTDLGDLIPIRWEKVVIVQVSVQGFREKVAQHKELMEEGKLLFEHTVLSRLSTEYHGQEILSQPRSGLFVVAFESEFLAAKWCLSLQLSLVYAAWSEKLLKAFDDTGEEYVRPTSKSKKAVLLFRGFRVRMVIHTTDPEVAPERALPSAVKWTNVVTDFAHGGQIILSDSVWDRLKEQLVQLGNPVVEDLGCHDVLDEEVMLMLLLPRDLELRRFPQLNSPYQLSPGMRDAPSAFKPVTMVFTFIEGARPLVRCHAEQLAERIKTLCMIARDLLRKHNGYECQELQGDFMLAFFHPINAIMWCGEFQLSIREMFNEWNRESDKRELMFSMSMGIETGVPASVSPHKTSGRADYFGNIVNQTARIAKSAHGGQVLIGGDAWNTFQTSEYDKTVVRTYGYDSTLEFIENSLVFFFKKHGYYTFKGIPQPIALIEAIPIESTTRPVEMVLRRVKAQHGSPKAKAIAEKDIDSSKRCYIEPVPEDMIRLHQESIECENETIRTTEFQRDSDAAAFAEFVSNETEEEHDVLERMVSGSVTLAMSQEVPSLMMQGFRYSGSQMAGSPTTESMERP